MVSYSVGARIGTSVGVRPTVGVDAAELNASVDLALAREGAARAHTRFYGAELDAASP
jgi:hypothetical protein